MNAVRKVDFFIVGAPKSGTTSLYFYLKDHPEIFMPRRKELYCFCRDLHFQYPLLSEKQFSNYYSGIKEKKAGDATVWNLFSSEAAKNIQAFNPQAQIIVILRNPIDVIQSLHTNHLFNHNETILRLEDALNAIEDRKQGKNIPVNMKSPVESLFYYDVVNYAEQVNRYFSIFGRDRVKVILFDDFIEQTPVVYAGILDFLGADQNFQPEFKIYNSRKSVRSALASQWISHAPSPIKKIGSVVLPHQSSRRDRIMQWAWKLNTKKINRRPLDDGLHGMMLEHLKPGIADLEKLLHWDLSGWMCKAAK